MPTNIFADFESRGVVRHSALLLPAEAALDFVRECRTRQLELLGFDGFTLLPDERIQPHLEHMLDLSAIPYKDLSVPEKLMIAEKFIEERLGTDLFFEMTV